MKNTAKNYKGEPMIDFGQEARAKFYSLRGKPTYDECGESYPTCFAIEVAINGEQPKFYADDESFFKKNEGKDIEIISCEEIANPNAVINAFFMEEVTPIATVYEIERNGNAKMVFTDLAISLTRLLHMTKAVTN